MEIEKIREVITKEVFGYFGRGDFKSGAKILRKLYLKEYNFLDDLETKRLILYNLFLAEYRCDNIDGAKKYINIIKKDMENDKEYISTYTDMYCNVLNCYIEFNKDEISEEERYRINQINYKYCKKVENYASMYVFNINMCFIDKDYNGIFESIKALHKMSINDNSIKKVIEDVLNELKENSKEYYDIAIDFLNQEELCVI